MVKPTSVKALPGFRLSMEFSDGTKGEIDLSRLASRGVFGLWNEPGAFERVALGPGRSIAWSDQVELCSDALYLQIKDIQPEELLRGLLPLVRSA